MMMEGMHPLRCRIMLFGIRLHDGKDVRKFWRKSSGRNASCAPHLLYALDIHHSCQ